MGRSVLDGQLLATARVMAHVDRELAVGSAVLFGGQQIWGVSVEGLGAASDRVRCRWIYTYLLPTVKSVFLVVFSNRQLGDQFPLSVAKVPGSNHLLSVRETCSVMNHVHEQCHSSESCDNSESSDISRRNKRNDQQGKRQKERT